jgi:hypothetical protein
MLRAGGREDPAVVIASIRDAAREASRRGVYGDFFHYIAETAGMAEIARGVDAVSIERLERLFRHLADKGFYSTVRSLSIIFIMIQKCWKVFWRSAGIFLMRHGRRG